MVNEIWAREIKLFGFDFNDDTKINGILKNKIDANFKKTIQYKYKTDTFLINGEIVE